MAARGTELDGLQLDRLIVLLQPIGGVGRKALVPSTNRLYGRRVVDWELNEGKAEVAVAERGRHRCDGRHG